MVDAASVLLLRDGTTGPEVFLIKRHDRSQGYGGMYVFPGGKVDGADARVDVAACIDQPAPSLHALLGEPALSVTAAASVMFAAVRELFEECGVLLVEGLDSATRARASELAGQGQALSEILVQLGLRAHSRALCPWSRWITPLNSINAAPKRFDTRFFVVASPPGQEPRHDNHEAVESVWLAPRTAITQYWQGDITMAPPQLLTLAHLARFPSVADILEETRKRSPFTVLPEVFAIDGQRAIAYPGDEAHPVAQRVMPGPTRLILRGKRLEPLAGFEGFFADH